MKLSCSKCGTPILINHTLTTKTISLFTSGTIQLLCSSCHESTSSLHKFLEDDKMLWSYSCSSCGKKLKTKALRPTFNESTALCDSCNRKRIALNNLSKINKKTTTTCNGCGMKIEITEKNLNSLNKKKIPIYCDFCNPTGTFYQKKLTPKDETHAFISKECNGCGTQIITKHWNTNMCLSCSTKKATDTMHKINTSPGICTVCGKFSDSRDSFGICNSCSANKAKKMTSPGFCTKCGKFSKSRNLSGTCPTCTRKIFKTTLKEIREFDFNDTLCNPNCISFTTCTNKDRPKNKWGWCKESPNLNNNFDRETFYSKHVKLTTYSSVDELLEDFDKLEGVPGVVDVGFHDGDKWVSLDVGQSVDLKQECLGYLRRLKGNKDLTDEEIAKKNERYSYNRKKYRNMMTVADERPIEFVLVARDVGVQKEREYIEAQHAHDIRSMFWSPAPGQEYINE